MRTYDELTDEERAEAIDKAYTELLEAVASGEVRWNDELNQNDMQAVIDEALRKADAMQTPWFAAEYVRDAVYHWDAGTEGKADEAMQETVGASLRSMAECEAEDALYPAPEERLIRL